MSVNARHLEGHFSQHRIHLKNRVRWDNAAHYRNKYAISRNAAHKADHSVPRIFDRAQHGAKVFGHAECIENLRHRLAPRRAPVQREDGFCEDHNQTTSRQFGKSFCYLSDINLFRVSSVSK